MRATRDAAWTRSCIPPPYLDVRRDERGRERPSDDDEMSWLAELTVQLVDEVIRPAVSRLDFWKDATRQVELRSSVFYFLDETGFIDDFGREKRYWLCTKLAEKEALRVDVPQAPRGRCQLAKIRARPHRGTLCAASTLGSFAGGAREAIRTLKRKLTAGERETLSRIRWNHPRVGIASGPVCRPVGKLRANGAAPFRPANMSGGPARNPRELRKIVPADAR